jgi:hypothetical protein
LSEPQEQRIDDLGGIGERSGASRPGEDGMGSLPPMPVEEPDGSAGGEPPPAGE